MTIRISIKQINSIVVLATLLIFSSICLAEVRVIVEYDHTGYRLLRVVDLPPSQSAPISDHLGGQTRAAITPNDATSKVKLHWYSADGVLISTALMDDPRLTHAPLTGADQAPSVVGLETGAFMVSGPSDSAVLEIHMPANVTLGLDQQFVRMELVQ